MDPVAPTSIAPGDMLHVTLQRMVDAPAAQHTLLTLGALFIGVLLLNGLADRALPRKGRRGRGPAIRVPARQVSGRTLSQQEGPGLTAAELRAHAIGVLGEGLVTAELQKAGWPFLRNIILEVNGRTTEIDHLVKVPDGIIALEVKTYSGFISGTEHDLYWTRHLSNEKHRLLSPIRQNLGHIRAIEAFLNDSRIAVRGFVVSAGRARFAPEIAPIPVPVSLLRRAILGEISATTTLPAVDAAWERLTAEASLSAARRAAHALSTSARKVAANAP